MQPLNIKVNVVAQPWPTLVARGAKAETAADMVAVYVTPVSTDPDVVAAQYASTAEGQFWGMHHLHDAELDDMIEKARLETDQAKRMAMYADDPDIASSHCSRPSSACWRIADGRCGLT